MNRLAKLCVFVLSMSVLCAAIAGCGGAAVEADPKTLAEEAAKLDKQAAEGEKGL